MYARYAFSIGSASAVTAGLLLIMHALVAMDGHGNLRPTISRHIDFRLPVRIDPPLPPPKQPKRPPDPTTAPDTMPLGRLPKGAGPKPVTGAISPDWHNGFEEGGARIDRSVLSLAAVQPAYPAAAAARGLEGYVTVQYTVSPLGIVTEAVVVDSSDPIFERAAINAIKRFRFRPRTVDGRAVETSNLHQRFRFVLNE